MPDLLITDQEQTAEIETPPQDAGLGRIGLASAAVSDSAAQAFPVSNAQLGLWGVLATVAMSTFAGWTVSVSSDAIVLAGEFHRALGQTHQAHRVGGPEGVHHRARGLEQRTLAAGADRITIDDEHDRAPDHPGRVAGVRRNRRRVRRGLAGAAFRLEETRRDHATRFAVHGHDEVVRRQASNRLAVNIDD